MELNMKKHAGLILVLLGILVCSPSYVFAMCKKPSRPPTYVPVAPACASYIGRNACTQSDVDGFGSDIQEYNSKLRKYAQEAIDYAQCEQKRAQENWNEFTSSLNR